MPEITTGQRPLGVGLGVGIIGAGDVVRGKHLPAMRDLASAGVLRLRAIYDAQRERAESMAAAAGIETVSDSIERMLDDPAVEAVLIATPNHLHRAGVEVAAGAGRHVLCEKPLAITLEDARAAIAACRTNNVRLQVGFHHRFQPQFVMARELVRSGVLGGVRSFQATISEPLDLIPGSGNYRFDGARSGGLTLIDIGTHRLDMLVALLGPMAAVHALFGSVAANDHVKEAGYELEDNAVLMIQAASGALGSLGAHRFSRAAMTGNILHGTRGILCYSTDITNPYQSAPLAVYLESPFEEWPESLRRHFYGATWWERPDRGWVSVTPPKLNCYRAEWESFVRAIRAGSETEVTGAQALHIQEIVLAAYESWRTGARVELPLAENFTAAPPRFPRGSMKTPSGG